MKNEKIIKAINQLAADVHENAYRHGWWDNWTDADLAIMGEIIGAKIALMHSELSEALEAVRQAGLDSGGSLLNPKPDEHLPEYDNFTVELADTIIRILDLADALKLPIGEAIINKHEYNKARPYRHGGKAL